MSTRRRLLLLLVALGLALPATARAARPREGLVEVVAAGADRRGRPMATATIDPTLGTATATCELHLAPVALATGTIAQVTPQDLALRLRGRGAKTATIALRTLVTPGTDGVPLVHGAVVSVTWTPHLRRDGSAAALTLRVTGRARVPHPTRSGRTRRVRDTDTVILTARPEQASHTPSPATVLATDFADAAALDGWQGAAAAALAPGRDDTYALHLAVADPAGTAIVRRPLDVTRLGGALIAVEAIVRAEDVARPAAAHDGVVLALRYTTPQGDVWKAATDVHGTFDWRRVRFTARVPADVSDAEVVAGIQHSRGTAVFDAIRVEIRRFPAGSPHRPVAGPIDKGHDLGQLRGFMTGANHTDEAYFRTLAEEWNANVIRWPLVWPEAHWLGTADDTDVAAWEAWLASALAKLDRALPWCERYGIRVVVDLHTAPAESTKGDTDALYHDPALQDAFVRAWATIAARYRDQPAVWAYDLLNEPATSTALVDLRDLLARAADAVRAVDPTTTIIVEPGALAHATALDDFVPLDVPGVVYSIHVYDPYLFTHQGVHGLPRGVPYPGDVGGVRWNKWLLRRLLEPARAFQEYHRVAIYVGEFSAVRWAPDGSAHRYLRDLIELLEEYGWDWTYHAFREWNGWSVEHGADPADTRPAPTPTDRALLLRGMMATSRRAPHAASAF